MRNDSCNYWMATLGAIALAACGGVSSVDSPDAGPSDAGSVDRTPSDGGAVLRDAAATETDASSSGSRDAGPPPALGICAACDGSCEASVELEPAWHLEEPIHYSDVPPAGGPHAACWGQYRVYDDPPLPASRWVHNLEHGAVVFLYHCPAGCETEVAALVALADARERTLVTPYPDMAPGFAVVAWGHRLVSSCLDIDAMSAFYDAYFDRAPESTSAAPHPSC